MQDSGDVAPHAVHKLMAEGEKLRNFLAGMANGPWQGGLVEEDRAVDDVSKEDNEIHLVEAGLIDAVEVEISPAQVVAEDSLATQEKLMKAETEAEEWRKRCSELEVKINAKTSTDEYTMLQEKMREAESEVQALRKTRCELEDEIKKERANHDESRAMEREEYVKELKENLREAEAKGKEVDAVRKRCNELEKVARTKVNEDGPEHMSEMENLRTSAEAVLTEVRNLHDSTKEKLKDVSEAITLQRQRERLTQLKEDVKKKNFELNRKDIMVGTLQQRVRETEKELIALKARLLVHEVNTVRHSNGIKKMIYLTNTEADLITADLSTTDEKISRMFHDMDLPRYHLVINLVICRGGAHYLVAKAPGNTANLKDSGILDLADTMKAEEELEVFMDKIVIPMAIEHKALVICEPSMICSISTAFLRAVKPLKARYGGKLPFTILASTYAISVHLRTSEKGSFEQRLMESSERWKRSSQQLKEGVKRYREVEGKKKLSESVLQNIGNLSVNDELSHYIFVEGIDDAAEDDTDRRPKMSSGQDTAWVRLLSKFFNHLVSNTPTVGLCTQEATPTTYPRLLTLLKAQVPVLAIDLRPRDFKPTTGIDDDSLLRARLLEATSRWVAYEEGIRTKSNRRETWDICTLAYLHGFLQAKKQGVDHMHLARPIRLGAAKPQLMRFDSIKTVGRTDFPTDADIIGVCKAIAINPEDGNLFSKDEVKLTPTITMLKNSNFWSCHVSEDLDELARNKNLFQALVMSEMVEPVRDKKMVFLSNWQTQQLNESDDGVNRLLLALGIRQSELELVINLINCRGVDHHNTALGASFHQSPIIDHDLVIKQEDELKWFMKKVVIPEAIAKKTLVICDTSTTCSMSTAFALAVESLKQKPWFKEKCKDGQLPFSILGTTYACAVHKRASNPRGQDFVSEVFKASRVWKKSEKMLSEAIETFKKDEKSNDSKIPQFVLDNFGNLDVTDSLTHYIFVDGMEMKLQGDGRQVPTLQMGKGTPWNVMIVELVNQLVSKHPSITLCSQEPGGNSNDRIKELLNKDKDKKLLNKDKKLLNKDKAPILMMDLRNRDHLPGGNSNDRIKELLNKDKAPILMMDLRNRDHLLAKIKESHVSLDGKGPEGKLIMGLKDWQEWARKRVFRQSDRGPQGLAKVGELESFSQNGESDNNVSAELWDYCTMAYFKEFLVPQSTKELPKLQEKVVRDTELDTEFPTEKHFELVAGVMVHQRQLEIMFFNLKEEVLDAPRKLKEAGGNAEALIRDACLEKPETCLEKLVIDVKEQRGRLEKLKENDERSRGADQNKKKAEEAAEKQVAEEAAEKQVKVIETHIDILKNVARANDLIKQLERMEMLMPDPELIKQLERMEMLMPDPEKSKSFISDFISDSFKDQWKPLVKSAQDTGSSDKSTSFWKDKNQKTVDDLRADIVTLMESPNVHSCLIDTRQQKRDDAGKLIDARFKKNRDLFQSLIKRQDLRAADSQGTPPGVSP